MMYTGPDSVVDVEADLAMSDDDEQSTEHWPSLESSDNCRPISNAASPLPQPIAPTAIKRSMPQDSDAINISTSPIAKASKLGEPLPQHRTSEYPLPRPLSQTRPTPSLTPPVAPAFAPRDTYVKLAFTENLSIDVKLRWLSAVTKAFRLDRELAEVKMSAVTSRFIYISRRRQDVIDKVMKGEFLSVHLDIQDSIERPRKFPSYLITRYPITIDPTLVKELPGVHTVRRFHQNGKPINRLVITWSFQEPPPSVVNFSFLPCLPSCELRRMKDEQPWCFKCWGIGHISRYCSAAEKCAWCAAAHATRSCPYRTPAPPAMTATSSSPLDSSPSPAPDTSQWKCPRCNMPGVNVWHGCAKKSSTIPPQRIAPPPPPPPLLPASSPSFSRPIDSAEVIDLRKAVASLETRCTALTARLDAIEARFDSLAMQQASTASTVATLVESNKVLITSVTTITERLDIIAARLDKLTVAPPKTPSPHASPGSATALTPSSSASRKSKSKVR